MPIFLVIVIVIVNYPTLVSLYMDLDRELRHITFKGGNKLLPQYSQFFIHFPELIFITCYRALNGTLMLKTACSD